MKTLFVAPEIRLDGVPSHFPFWAGILAAIAEKKGGQVAIYDLNALRTITKNQKVPSREIYQQVSKVDWDLICIGGLTTAYSRISELVKILRKASPNSIILSGGGWCTYNPDEILQLVPEIDLICIGEGEETFSEIYDQIEKNIFDFENIKGLCINKKNSRIFTEPRALISDLNVIPYPAYHLLETEIYFRYSSLPLSVEAYNCKKRASVVWERGCPRGCTFCSHNGMSRIDLQNIYGSGDRKAGEKIVKSVDILNDTFQLPARWPSPKYAIDNIKILKEKYNVDFISILDENMTSNLKWTKEFCELYVQEGLHESVKWGTLGDAPSVAVKPEIVKIMKDAGCSYISFGFESASDKVLNQDIGKGQLQIHEQKTIDAVKKANLTPLATFMIGNPHEDINDLMETVVFWIKNNIEISPFICTPYVGSPLNYTYKDFILGQYDERIKLVNELKLNVDKKLLSRWKLNALDAFMRDCGDATNYTATVSQYFTIPELIALKEFMYKKDLRRILQMAHEKFEKTNLQQWNHNAKWSEYCDVCKSKDELKLNMSLSH